MLALGFEPTSSQLASSWQGITSLTRISIPNTNPFAPLGVPCSGGPSRGKFNHNCSHRQHYLVGRGKETKYCQGVNSFSDDRMRLTYRMYNANCLYRPKRKCILLPNILLASKRFHLVNHLLALPCNTQNIQLLHLHP